jgi:hypothetical protein
MSLAPKRLARMQILVRMPDAGERAPAARAPPSLTQFVVLSLLVHLLAVVLFRQPLGVPGGHGRALPSMLEVVLRPLARVPAAEAPTAPPPPRRPIAAPARGPSSESVSDVRRAPASEPSANADLMSNAPAPVALPQQPLTPFRIEPVRPIERELPPAPEMPPPLPMPAEPLPPIELPAPRALERELPPAPELAAPAPLPAQPLPSVEALPQRAIERELPPAPELPPAAALPSQPLPPVEAPMQQPFESALQPAPELPPAAPLPTQPLAPIEAPRARAIGPAPSLDVPRRGVPDGAPSQRLFAPALPAIEPKQPAADEAPTRHFDFDRARDVARDFNRGVARTVEFEPPPAERVTPLGRAIQKAAQPDCRDAYAALGLLGLIPLIADTVMDRGCRW